MAKKKDEDFALLNDLPEECKDSDIKAEDFTLVNISEDSHEQKFQTKPTTFLKDSLRRFRKNKSSVVATYILGALILLAIIVPFATRSEGPYDLRHPADSAFYNLQPKLFKSGTNFWDGTTKKEHVPIDASTGYPDPVAFKRDGIKDLVISDPEYTNEISAYAMEGYYHIGYYGTYDLESFDVDSPMSTAKLDLNVNTITMSSFVVVDEALLATYENNAEEAGVPQNFVLGLTSLNFVYMDGTETEVIELLAPKASYNIGGTKGTPEAAINVTNLLKTKLAEKGIGQTQFTDFYFTLHISRPEGAEDSSNVCSLVRSFVMSVEDTADRGLKSYFGYSYVDGNKTRTVTGISFASGSEITSRKEMKWSSTKANRGVLDLYAGKCIYGSFTFDSYSATLGRREVDLDLTELNYYKEKGWISFNIDADWDEDLETYVPSIDTWTPVEILDEKHCPVIEPFDISDVYLDNHETGGTIGGTVVCEIYYYKYLGYTEMPKFLFGTDESGHDLFKYVFEGLRNSLILGVITFAVCFLFGLLWGAISGYFGGAVDMVMERVTDILAGIPWIVLMTIIILKFDSSFGTFALALCLTGWIGTASTTRTQFYRFRGREYVLASRTLGASDARLIAKHILPNAMGTIITGAVLMIPSVIFSEATISYLGLGFRNLSSLGVILSDNQKHLLSYPFQLIFPSVVIALIMISFNLFGNGLRDAINPSSKGEDE